MRAFKIDVIAKTVTEIDISGELKSLQEVVGGYIELAREINDTDNLYVDEEGLLKGQLPWFEITGGHQPFIGHGVIIGSDDEGETIGAKASLTEIQAMVTFLDYEDVVRRYRRTA